MARKQGAAAVKPKKAIGNRLVPPLDAVTVRMYRIGHGDCFLLAFPGESENKPVYVLIDCGYKPGSPKYIDPNRNVADITKNIREATGGQIDVAIITHEHQDHVNAITAGNFAGFKIGETWLAWTENPEDEVANTLRDVFKDKLLGVLAARNRLAAAGDADGTRHIEAFLAFELGGDSEAFDDLLAVAGGDPANSMNKKSIKIFKDLAQNGVKYIRPHQKILSIPGTKDIRVFALGPPRNADKLKDVDPRTAEQFHEGGLALASPGNYLAAAAAAQEGHGQPPFAKRYALCQDTVLSNAQFGSHFTAHYGGKDTPPTFSPGAGEAEVSDNAEWRRIDNEWLYSAERLALDMNSYTNNASLVLAFEIGKGGKVLLFAADAQRGNWVSWTSADWTDGDKKVTARDLLSRTVLYKVGHHGSHNATLNGLMTDEHPNIAWMAQDDYAHEFIAMITAVRKWAEKQNGWDHPLKEIKDALIKKASGRVFQTDTDISEMKMPEGGSTAEWKRFIDNTTANPLYFDYTIRKE